jgi:hypothetical protein
VEKQHQKDKQELIKLTDLQLQNNILTTPKPRTKRSALISKKLKPKRPPKVNKKIKEEVISQNHHSQQIQLPKRYG